MWLCWNYRLADGAVPSLLWARTSFYVSGMGNYPEFDSGNTVIETRMVLGGRCFGQESVGKFAIRNLNGYDVGGAVSEGLRFTCRLPMHPPA